MRRLSFQIIFFLLSINVFAQSPHGDNFDVDCSNCHVSDNWKVNLSKVTFDHSTTKFSLVGQHQNVDCKSCHTSLVFSNASTDCFSCHKDIHQSTVGFDCASCHTPTSWVVKDIVGVHQNSRFPLLGAHKLADCAQCHSGYTELRFDVLSVDCYACHSQDYNSAQSPNHLTANFSKDCQECHNVNALTWNTTNVNHSFFPLTGGHALPSCFSCHQQNTFSGLSPECYACHQQTYNSTTNPNHISAGLPTTCEVCHNINGWKPASIDHNLTQFPLTGKHIPVDCADCHTSGYTGTPTNCYACHQQDYQNVNDPNHVTSQFPTDCSLCHTTAGWENATIDHNLTQFPLTGKHIPVDCADCHTSSYTGTPTNCYACHQQDYQNVNDPNHVTSQFSTDCSLCHTTAGWDNATFDHNQSSFPLTGSHIQAACASCHSSGYTGTPTDCYTCHQQDFNGTTDPNHLAQNYPHDCTLCHNTTNWSDANFDHNTTQFPLTGSHVQVACATCHTSGYTGTPTDCYACHQTNYNNTTNPNHQAAGFPTSCIDCHNTTNWNQATFDHDAQYFPIYSGKHNGEWNQCSDCHTTPNNFSVFSCIDCHEHNRTDTDDKHQGVQGYVYNSADCFACHPQGRKEGAFNHATSNFVLVGVHLTTDCVQCHENGYINTTTLCSDCHISDYNSTANPNHQALNLSTDCAACHTPNANWQPGLFPQHNQVFQLTGRHLEIANDCASCHNGNYTTTPNQCVGCHQSAFNNAVNPNHAAAGIPTSCQDCHGSSAWIPSSFNHTTTGFELIGSHQPLQCSSCHLGAVTGLNNQCITCHQAQFNTAPNHTAQSYPTNCELCHNSVAWDQTSFNHQNTNFPLTGAHITTTCQDCHSTGYIGTPTECYSCHQSDYENTIDPNHVTQNYPHDCTLCHNTSNWDDANFDHSTTQFPLTGAHIQVGCENCHASGYSGTPTDCYSCHQSNYMSTTDPPHDLLNFATTCTPCHTTNGWTPATFDHNFYRLRNQHSSMDCSECHSEPNYQPQCLSCHMDDFLDEHNLGDRTDCWNCHATNNWDSGLIVPHLQEQRVD